MYLEGIVIVSILVLFIALIAQGRGRCDPHIERCRQDPLFLETCSELDQLYPTPLLAAPTEMQLDPPDWDEI
jgi:hypothetical protein